MNIKEFADLLIRSDLATIDELHGCSEREIEALEKHMDASLPQSYREFLAVMGRNAGNFMRGSDFLYKHPFELTTFTKETIVHGPFPLPDDAFVFSSHQGYIFAYFRLSDGDDPAIYTYMEGESKPQRWASSFSEYLEKSLKEQLS